jgi:hypothetical protein
VTIRFIQSPLPGRRAFLRGATVVVGSATLALGVAVGSSPPAKASDPHVTFVPALLNFGSVRFGGESEAQSSIMTNTSGSWLRMEAMHTAVNHMDFVVAEGGTAPGSNGLCQNWLAPGAKCLFIAKFKPTHEPKAYDGRNDVRHCALFVATFKPKDGQRHPDDEQYLREESTGLLELRGTTLSTASSWDWSNWWKPSKPSKPGDPSTPCPD